MDVVETILLEVAQRGLRVSMHFGCLTTQTCLCSNTDLFSQAWPHKLICDHLLRRSDERVSKAVDCFKDCALPAVRYERSRTSCGDITANRFTCGVERNITNDELYERLWFHCLLAGLLSWLCSQLQVVARWWPRFQLWIARRPQCCSCHRCGGYPWWIRICRPAVSAV